MKLGFLTACLPNHSLSDIAEWAAANGFEAPSSTASQPPTVTTGPRFGSSLPPSRAL